MGHVQILHKVSWSVEGHLRQKLEVSEQIYTLCLGV